MDEDLGGPLMALDVVEPPRTGRRRTRWVVAVLVAAALVAGVVVAVTLVRHGGTPPARVTAGDDAGGRTDPATQVVHDGDRVEGSGEVVAVDGQAVVFCAPEAEAADGGAAVAGAFDPFAGCHHHVTITGLDLTTLTHRTAFPASAATSGVSGYAHLVGTYRDGALTDVVQSPYVEAGVDFPPPPCPTPAGGWPAGPRDANMDTSAVDRYRTDHPDDVVSLAELRPSATQVVMYVLTGGDPAPVETALRPAYGDALCVVRSAYTRADLAAAESVFDLSKPLAAAAGGTMSSAEMLFPDAQLGFELSVPMVTDDLVAAAARFPAGLVQFAPWLAPVA